jgi:two-component system LytT family response regulator
MRVLIVDDERPARERLRRMLAAEPGIDAVDEAADGFTALERIAAFKPDAVFLDIQMPELSGIELAASLPQPAPLVVFVTAFDDYAVAAFDANAIDYLLKPFDSERLQRALARLRERLAVRAAAPSLASVQQLERLVVAGHGGTRIVQVDDIEWIETADNYVALHTATGSPLLRQPLGSLLDQLGPRFIRCHRRAAVRLACVERVVPLDKGDCQLVLKSGVRVPCSRQYRAALIERL